MIPAFDKHGYLPPGIHLATIAEIAVRFGTESELRRVQIDSLQWMTGLAWRAGVLRIIVNGSFVTSKSEPNDVDCVLLIDDSFPRDASAHDELLAGLPFLMMEFVRDDGFRQLTERTFATDRYQVPKGMIEVLP